MACWWAVLFAAAAASPAARPETQVAGRRPPVTSMVADADGVYWSEPGCRVMVWRDRDGEPHELWRPAAATSTPAAEPPLAACALALDARGLFVMWNRGIWSIPRAGGTPERMATSPYLVAMAGDGRRWYGIGPRGEILVIGGKKPKRLATVPRASALTVDDEWLVIADPGVEALVDYSERGGRDVAETRGGVFDMPRSGGRLAARADLAHACGLAATRAGLYVSEGGRISVRQGSRVEILVASDAGCAIAATDKHLYWLRSGAHDDVVRIELTP